MAKVTPDPSVSVIVCAYTEERWTDLEAAIRSVQHQSRPPTEIVLVIDHNPALFGRARAQFAGVQVIENADARGVSGARNSGIAIARGELIAFLDDDAVAAPDWLAWMCAPFDEPHVLGSGGLLEPNWVAGRPAWFPEEFLWVVGCSYRGLPERTADVRNPIGGSFCMRRQVFDDVGSFGTELGRVGTVPLGCEETELSIRARRHWPEGRFVFEPRARVLHTVPAGRGAWRYFRARCHAEGLSKARLAYQLGAADSLSSERTYVSRTLPTGVLRGLRDALLGRDPNGLRRACAIVAGLTLTTAGYLVGSRAERRRA
jgi:glycosyltransferase involved in cell wall biosynthesis